ncbi:hypothetical protein DL93DRAFT_988195 [Clavulina sp. PMI_390]|nr:hypothetical protein DL93DRAFT_988195 [Clavulina sp. PMI_390]
MGIIEDARQRLFHIRAGTDGIVVPCDMLVALDVLRGPGMLRSSNVFGHIESIFALSNPPLSRQIAPLTAADCSNNTH